MRDYLEHRKDAIVARWTELTLEEGVDDRRFAQNADRFRNAVGFVMRENLRSLLEALLDGTDADGMAGRLDAIIKLRMVQCPGAGRVVSFVPSLKGIIRQELCACPQVDQGALAVLEARIDALAQTAAGLFRRCREQIGEIKLREERRRTWVSRRIAAKYPAGGHA